MSWEASTYVLGQTVGSAARKLVLMGFANHAHKDGTAAFPSILTIMEYAECSRSTAQRHVSKLVEDGFMREGDQELVAHYPANKRPIVYDVAMSEAQRAEWQVLHVTGGNTRREAAKQAGKKGGEASAQVSRGVKTTPLAVASNGEVTAGVKMTPQDGETGGVIPDGSGVSSEPVGGVTGDTQTFLETNLETTHSSSSDSADAEPDATPRPDVTRVCEHLRQRIIDNGYKPTPNITQEWLRAARLLMDRDGRSETQVHNMIDWATQHEFWRPNIKSMPKLREKYDQMREQAMRDTQRAEQAAVAPRRGDIDWQAAFDRADAFDAEHGLGGGA